MMAPNQSRLPQPSSMPTGSPDSRQAPSTSPHTGRVLPKFLHSLCAPALPSPATPTPPAAPLLPNSASLQAGSTPLLTSQPAEDSSSAAVQQFKEETHTSPPPPPSASASSHGQVCTSPLVTGNTALQSGVPTAVSITSPVVCGTSGTPSTPCPLQCSPSVVACSPHAAPLSLHLQPNLAQDTRTLTLPNTSQPLSGVPHNPPIPLAHSILSSPIPNPLAGQVADSSVGITNLLLLHDPLPRRPLSSSPQASTVSACPAPPSEPATKEGLSHCSKATEKMCGGVGMEMGTCEGEGEGALRGVIRKRKNVRVVERRGKKRQRGEAALSKEGECVGSANPAHTAGVHRCGCCGAALLQCESTDTALPAREEGTGLAYVHNVWVTWLPVLCQCVCVCVCVKS